MGLDVQAFAKLVDLGLTEASRPFSGAVLDVSPLDDFEGYERDLKSGHRYGSSESFRFGAGSYRFYNSWRNELAAFGGYPAIECEREGEDGEIETAMRHDVAAWEEFTEGPFWELINFSDAEGIIGPVLSGKLAKDFAEFQERANTHPDDGFRDQYSNWRKAFEMAAQGGAVELC